MQVLPKICPLGKSVTLRRDIQHMEEKADLSKFAVGLEIKKAQATIIPRSISNKITAIQSAYSR